MQVLNYIQRKKLSKHAHPKSVSVCQCNQKFSLGLEGLNWNQILNCPLIGHFWLAMEDMLGMLKRTSENRRNAFNPTFLIHDSSNDISLVYFSNMQGSWLEKAFITECSAKACGNKS